MYKVLDLTYELLTGNLNTLKVIICAHLDPLSSLQLTSLSRSYP
jgi:hypothetical protein